MANIGKKCGFSVGFEVRRRSKAVEMTRFGSIVQYPSRQPQRHRLTAPVGRAPDELIGDACQVRLAIKGSNTQLLRGNTVVRRQILVRNRPAAALMSGVGQKLARRVA